MHLSAQKTLAISKLAGIVMLVGVLAATSATGVLVYNYTKGPANVNESCTSTTIEFNNYTQAIAFDPKNHDIYVGVAPNHVEVVSDATNKVIKEITVSGHIITSISYNPANGLLYAAQQLTLENTTIIDGSTNNIVGSLSFEAPVPNADTYNPSLGIYYYDYFLFSYPSNTILAVSATTNKIVQNISLGSQSSAGYLLYNDVNGRLYSFSNNWAYSINPESGVVVSKINLGANVSGYALDPSTGNIYVTLENITSSPTGKGLIPGQSDVSMIDVSTNVVQALLHVPLPLSPVYIQPIHRLYFIQPSWNLVGFDTQTHTILSNVTLTAQSLPLSALYDPVNTCLYVSSYLEGPNVSVIATG